jgi:hypothetical protein
MAAHSSSTSVLAMDGTVEAPALPIVLGSERVEPRSASVPALFDQSLGDTSSAERGSSPPGINVNMSPVLSIGNLMISFGASSAGSSFVDLAGSALDILPVESLDTRPGMRSLLLLEDVDRLLRVKLMVKPLCFKVYSRKHRNLVINEINEEQEICSGIQDFKNCCLKPISSLLSPPASLKKRRKKLPADFRPRRSRRVARLPPEIRNSSDAQVCMKLGYCDEKEQISDAGTSRYARLFDSPLSYMHVAALAALFSWEVPLELQTSA